MTSTEHLSNTIQKAYDKQIFNRSQIQKIILLYLEYFLDKNSIG